MSGPDDTLREELGSLLDGALPEERARALRRRIEEDEALRREYEELARAVEAVRGLPRAAAPPSLRLRLEAALAAPRAARGYRVWALAAALLVAVAGGVFLLAPERPPVHTVAREADRDDAPRAQPPDGAGRRQAPEDDRALALEKVLRDDVQSRAAAARERKKDSTGAKAADEAFDAPVPGVAEARAPAEPAKEERPSALLASVAKSGRLWAKDREQYLAELARLEPEKLRRHVASFALSPAPAREGEALEDKRVEEVLSVLLASGAEARVVGQALRPFAAGEAGMSLEVHAAQAHEVATLVEGTADELARLSAWLHALDASLAAEAGALRGLSLGEPAGRRAEAGKGGGGPKQRLRVVLRYAPKEPPGEEAEAEAEDR